MVSQIGVLERQLDDAAKQIAAMRQELAEVRQGPIKRALLAAAHGLEHGISALGARLDELKAAVVDGCKRTLAAVRERGISVLAHTARFFHLGPAVEAFNRLIDHNISTIDRGIAQVERDSRNYHEAGRRVRNAGRALLGQPRPRGRASWRTRQSSFFRRRNPSISLCGAARSTWRSASPCWNRRPGPRSARRWRRQTRNWPRSGRGRSAPPPPWSTMGGDTRFRPYLRRTLPTSASTPRARRWVKR